ncbi:MAG: sensor domain-containing diguanylate cyclase [Betaproteobacteria bacterium]|nr:sensor domain-containing diguanylate cyclase [Betaproteobacteria bacterium]
MAVTLADGTIEYANPHLRRLLDLGAAQTLGPDLAEFREAGGASLPETIRGLLLAGKSWQGETHFRTATGEARHVLESIYPLPECNRGVTRFIHFFQDFTALKLAETLKNLAFYDSLTGLPNRNLLADRVSRAIAAAQRNCSRFALLYIDIDHFKRVNDTLGHDAGDALLRQLAARLQKCIRRTDTVARLGGDEFVVILDKVADRGPAVGLARKLLETCSEDYDLPANGGKVTLSVGISLYPRDGSDMEALLKCADAAMYRAKAKGGNGYRLCQSPLSAQCGSA